MIYPDDLPHVLEYRLGTYNGRVCTMVTLPRKPVEYVSTSGKTTACTVCPNIPYGCTGWRLMGDKEWRPLSEIPPEWIEFLDRRRLSEMDPRPPTKVKS